MKNAGEYIRGHTDTIILSILNKHDSYGYEISKTVSKISNGEFQITEATFYNAFKRLILENKIAHYWLDGDNGTRRKYYSITEIGKESLNQSRLVWKKSRVILDSLIGGQNEK